MANTEISRLTELPAGGVQANDPLPIADLSASETKKITAVNLVQGGINALVDGGIPGSKVDLSTAAPNSLDGGVLIINTVPGDRIVDDSLTALQIAPDAIGSSELADGAVDNAALQSLSVTGDKVAANTLDDGNIVLGGIGTSSLADGSVTYAKTGFADSIIPGAKIVNKTITSDQIANGTLINSLHAPTSITFDKLNLFAGDINAAFITQKSIAPLQIQDNSLTTAVYGDLSISTAKLQDLSVTNGKVGDFTLEGSKLVNNTLTNINYATDSVDSRVMADDGIATSNLQDLSVTEAKIAQDISASKLLDGSITNAKLDIDSVQTVNLVDDAVTTEKVLDGAVTDVKLGIDINAARLLDASITSVKFDPGIFTNGIHLNAGVVGHDNNVVAATISGITYDEFGHITASTALVDTDLPPATVNTIGAISVPADSGLIVSAAGAIDHVAVITPDTVSGVEVDEHGHVIGLVPLVGTDLPFATNIDLGGVIVSDANSNPLEVDGAGVLTHTQTGVTAGTYASVEVDEYGHIQSASPVLAVNQVPGLPSSSIISGQFGTTRIEDDAVTRDKIADYAIAYIQEAEPPTINPCHIGSLWLQESTAQLRMWNGNSWYPVGFGRLSEENLRFGGTIDATTGAVINLTDFGRQAGLSPGDQLPQASDDIGGLYFVVEVPGNGIGVTAGITYDAGDWVLCVNRADGWVRIDTLSGGGATTILLQDLLNVDINNVQTGDTLIYDGNLGQWINRTTTADRVSISPAFDGTTTQFTLSTAVLDQNNVLMSIAGVIQEPGVDFVIASGSTTIDFASPPPANSPYFLLNQATVNAGGGGSGGTTLTPGTSAEEYLGWNNTLGAWEPKDVFDGGSF